MSAAGEATRGRWLGGLGYAGGLILGGVLLVAAWAKALDPAALAQQVADEGLAWWLPAEAVALLALALEVALGVALVLGLRRGWVLIPASLLVGFFLFLTGRVYWRSLHGELPADAGCGCFGNLVQRTPGEAFWQDLLLLVPPLGLAWLARPHRLRWLGSRLSLVAASTAAVVLLGWKAPDLPLDDLATRLRPGVEVAGVCLGDPNDGSEVCLNDVVPELAEGHHVVAIVDVTEPAAGEKVEELNAYHWGGRGPRLWILSGAAPEELFAFHFGFGPSFEIREAPPGLLRPLYRTLPRSFLVADGRVAATYAGWPPLSELATSGAGGPGLR